MVNSGVFFQKPTEAMAEEVQRLDWRLHGRLRRQLPKDLDDQGGVPTARGVHGAGAVHLRLGVAGLKVCCGILYGIISLILLSDIIRYHLTISD